MGSDHRKQDAYLWSDFGLFTAPTETEKLSLFVGEGKSVTMEDLRTLVPNAAQTTISRWLVRWAEVTVRTHSSRQQARRADVERSSGTSHCYRDGVQQGLGKALAAIYETDKKFREGYRDDRVVMETLVLALTGK